MSTVRQESAGQNSGRQTAVEHTAVSTIEASVARTLALRYAGLRGSCAIGRHDAIAEIPARHGWIRTLGGGEAYVALQARRAQGAVDRSTPAAALAADEMCVVPAVRGCIYLVARRDAPLALRLADLASAQRAARELEKVGVAETELDELGAAVLDLLDTGPRTTHALRIALGDAVRSLGEVGKKVGLSSTLPPTLRRLEFAGRIERRLEDDRLDHERYRWQRATRPIDEAWDAKPARLRTLAARRFVEATGIAAVDAFATWSGFGKRDARAALDDAQLEPISIDGVEGDFRAVPELLAEARSIDASLRHRPSDPIFLPFEDHLLAAFGGPAFWVDPRHHALPTPTWGSGPSTLGTARRAWIRPILIGDRVRACWDWHPTERRIVVAPFDVDSSAERTHLRAAADRFGDALATELGHGRIHSIDGEKTARRRLERLAALAPLI